MFIQKFNLTWEDVRIPYSEQYQALCSYTVLKSIKEYKKDIGASDYSRFLCKLARKPMYEQCWWNALAYKKHINSKAELVFGKKGWRRRDGSPVFLFG